MLFENKLWKEMSEKRRRKFLKQLTVEEILQIFCMFRLNTKMFSDSAYHEKLHLNSDSNGGWS